MLGIIEMSNYAILVRHPNGSLVAMMRGSDTDDIAVAEFETIEEAERLTDEHAFCRAFPHQIVTLDV